jgi:beta-phosphoglucomutase-like phosphatase (HAD superfamily)
MKYLNLQAVMIDLDGTMVDTIGDFEVALNRTYSKPLAH